MNLKELITDDTNEILQPAYVMGGIAFVVGIGLAIYSMYSGKPFDLQSYGIGVGALIAGVEGGKWIGCPKKDNGDAPS